MSELSLSKQPSHQHPEHHRVHSHSLPLSVRNPAGRRAAFAIACFAWLTTLVQTFMTVNREVSSGMSILEGFDVVSSYLTNLTVLLTAIGFTALALPANSRAARRWPLGFLRKPPVATAIVVYMAFVGVAYNTLLRHLWMPTGFREVVNESLHSALPLMTLLYWVVFVPRFHLRLSQFMLWLVYPLGYLWLTLWRGGQTGFYPYPFIDVAVLGYAHVMRNAVMLLGAFVTLMGLFVAGNYLRKAMPEHAGAPHGTH
jgi:hypothetical protein